MVNKALSTNMFLWNAQALVGAIEFPGWAFKLSVEHTDVILQVGDPNGTCNVTGKPLPWWGRKWRLSIFMTDGEVVQTAWLAVMTALEHEARESFKFQGVAVMEPHRDIHAVVRAMKTGMIPIKERD